MNRIRIVTNSFEAKKHAKVPSESSRFRTGERLVLLRREGAHSIFTREADRDISNPYITSDDVFETHTEVSKPSSPR